MKLQFLYLLVFIFNIACKTDRKQSAQNVVDKIVVVDSVKNQKKNEQKASESQSLRDKLIGTIYTKHYEIPEFKGYSAGSNLIGDLNSDYSYNYDYKGKKYSSSNIVGEQDVVKYVVFRTTNSKDSNKVTFKIIDLLEVDKKYQQIMIGENAFFWNNIHVNGKKDPELFALVSYNKKTEELTNIYNVWRTNRETEKIEEIKDFSGIKIIEEDEDY